VYKEVHNVVSKMKARKSSRENSEIIEMEHGKRREMQNEKAKRAL
jgi:hypothetical protein